MKPSVLHKLTFACSSFLFLAWVATAGAQAPDDSALAKKTQNPVSDLISLPLQSNFNTGVGPNDDLQYILNIQPVIAISLNDDWNLINRTVAPVIYQPELAYDFGDEWGLGDITHSLFLSPSGESLVTWGAGPVIQFPSATDASLGAGEWGLGPTAVVVATPSPWVAGVLVSNVWSIENDDVNFGLIQYFVNYNLPDGWYLSSAPVNTVDWNADSGERWTVPLGLGVGKVHRFGRQPINISAHAYYNVEHPTDAAEWQFRLQFQLLFPKS